MITQVSTIINQILPILMAILAVNLAIRSLYRVRATKLYFLDLVDRLESRVIILESTPRNES